jgi:hypothetical protein
MASIVINHLQALCNADVPTGIAVICCNYKKRQEQAVTDIVAVLLKQLCAQCVRIPQAFALLFDQHTRKRTQLAVHELGQALRSVAAAFGRVFVIVDALDECASSNGHAVVAKLRAL